MQKIMDYINIEILFVINLITFLLLILMVCINRLSIKKIKKKYKNIFQENKDGSLGDKINQFFKESDEIKEDYKKIADKLSNVEGIVNYSLKKVAIIRYNAFDNVGSDLSFSIAMLNDKDNGIVLSGLYSRDSSTTYAKPIENSESKYNLSEEEKKVIIKAKEDYDKFLNKKEK